MQPQSFIAPDSQTALAMIQQELGSDAVILSVRQVPGGPAWQTWKPRQVEILAVGGKNSTPPGPQVETASKGNVWPTQPATQGAQKGKNTAGSSKAELAALLARLAAETVRTQRAPSPAAESKPKEAGAATEKRSSMKSVTPAMSQVQKELLSQGLDSGLLEKISATCLDAINPRGLENDARIRNYIAQQLEAYVAQFPKNLLAKRTHQGPNILCMVGMSGTGKTSTSAKLATYASQKLKLKVAWISADTVRSGAIALARAYTQPLEIPLHLAYTAKDMTRALEACTDCDVVIVDTPACNPRRENDLVEIGDFLNVIPNRNTFLVAPGVAKEDDLQEAASAFGTLGLQGLIFTKLDETDTYGNLYNLAWRSQIPLAYFADGPRATDEIHIAGGRGLVRLLMQAKIL